MKKTLQKIILSICYFILMTGTAHAQELLAFPGAEGFGRYSKGARGATNPEVYHVTNLDDSGPGSLRDAISQPGRIVVFDVSGVIRIKDRLVFKSNQYIAGQTAPGDGIIIYGNGTSSSGCHNLIVRHLRIYMGVNGKDGADAAGAANGSNMIFDHTTSLWGLDENFSFNPSTNATIENITIQNSIIGQGLLPHSCGGLIQTDGGVSIIGCLYIDNSTRNPKVKGLNQFINNVVYNWGSSNGYIMGGGSTGDSWAWLEGNYFIAGPNSSRAFTGANTNFQIYHKENKLDLNKNGILDGDWAVDSDYGNAKFVTDLSGFSKIPQAFPDIAGGILSADDALTKVIESVGASLPARSHVDDYLINELTSYGTKGALIAHEKALGLENNIGIVCTATLPDNFYVTNEDIPDAWHEKIGFDPAIHKATDIAPNGYMYIENYINSIDGPIVPYLRCVSEIKYVNRTLNSIEFSWKNNTPDADEYLIQIAEDGEDFRDFATINGSAFSFVAEGLEKDTYYSFRLITKKTGLEDSTPSESFRNMTMGDPLPPDVSITPEPAIGETTRFYNSIDFTWDNLTRPWGGDIFYSIYLGSSPETLEKIAEGLSDKAFTYDESKLNMNETYYWRVDAENDIDYTEGDLWHFVTGTYSFTTSHVDIGRDFDGTSSRNAETGTLISSASSYTINGEMTIKASNSGMINTGTTNGVYGNNVNYSFFYINNDSYYIEGTLTEENSKKVISSVKINGTSDKPAYEAGCYILFSDAYNFDPNSIIRYDDIELAACRSGNEGTIIKAPQDAKSFRIYRKVTLTMLDENLYMIGGNFSNTETLSGSQAPRIAYIGVELQLISQDDPNYKDPDNTIKNLTINGKTAIANQEEKTFTYQFLKGTEFGEWPVAFELGSNLATTDFKSGSTHNFANGPLNITVTAENGNEAIYTVIATISDKTTIGMLTSTGAAANYDNLILSALQDYNIQFITASDTAPVDINEFYQDYDLLILHASVPGTNATGLATKEMVGIKPILNLKAFFYSNGRWNWANPSNTEAGRINSTVDIALQDHPIFKNVVFDDDKLVLFAEPTTVANAFQYTESFNGSNWTSQMNAANNTIATIDGNANKIHIHELNLDNSAKYLMFGLSNEGDSYTRFNENALTMIKNAVEYLLDPNIAYDFTQNTGDGIQNNSENSIIYYADGIINNPEMVDITIYNSMGIAVLSSKDYIIDVQNLSPGLYIIKTKTSNIKFIK